MKKIVLSLALIGLIQSIGAQPLPVSLTHNIIIDTDCGMDDFRAISILLSRPEVKIKAILATDGSLPPSVGAEKVSSLLKAFGREDIQVAAGKTLKEINPSWRQFNSEVKWSGPASGRQLKTDAAAFLAALLKSQSEKTVVVCLGPMTTLADALRKDASLKGKIEKIIWYSPANPFSGFNYEIDKTSAGEIAASRIRIDAISNLKDGQALFDSSLYALCERRNTKLADVLFDVFSQPVCLSRLNQGHFRLDDDLVSVYLTNPELFGINVLADRLNIRYNTVYDITGIRSAISDMITGRYFAERNVVFNAFPVDHQMFDYDIRPIIDSAIARFGHDEWKANVMTDEFHGHLGVFSIVGAKMGIRAREIFGVGPDMLDVTTFAGTKPPYSCLNDGIQVSTGATLGMGTIHLSADTIMNPSAIFRYKDKAVKLTLKKEYLDKVEADINEGIVKYGLMDDGYWKLIRKNALKYWLDWDRNTIFDVEFLNKK